MNFKDHVIDWQKAAVKIEPPAGRDRARSIGGLFGPAFFPEGFGLSARTLQSSLRPEYIAIGHNFGCESYRERIGPSGREDSEATWRNLDALIQQSGHDPDLCFRTNWFIGLMPGEEQKGIFLKGSDDRYEEECLALLLREIDTIRPKALLLLGPEVARRAYRLSPELNAWRTTKTFAELDNCSLGPSVKNLLLPKVDFRTNVVVLLHPSFAGPNRARRLKAMLTPRQEVDMVRDALA